MEPTRAQLPLAGRCIAFMIGKTTRPLEAGSTTSPRTLKSVPKYSELISKQRVLRRQTETILEREVELRVKAVFESDVIVEAEIAFDDLLDNPLLELRQEVLRLCRGVLTEFGCVAEFDEAYTVYCISDYQGDPEVYLTLHGERIAGLLKNERMALDEEEISATLGFNLKYAKDDLAIVDWDGALVFDPRADFAGAIELFETANLKLLHARMLDRQLDQRLQSMAQLLRGRPERRWLRAPELRRSLREIIQVRTTSILESAAIDQNVKLIGDWYSARLYSLTSRKLHLDEWDRTISRKLDVLEDVYAMATENFSISASKRLEAVLIVGWFILLAGWFTLLFLEMRHFN